MLVSGRASQHCHQLHGCREESSEPGGGVVHRQPRAKMWFLGGDTHRTVVGVTGPHADAPDRLNSRIGNRDTVGAQCQCLGEVRWLAQAASDDQRDAGCVRAVQMAPGPGQGGDRWDRDVVAEDQRSRTGTSAAAIQNDVLFDVLGG